jgi:hypothetical protein
MCVGYSKQKSSTPTGRLKQEKQRQERKARGADRQGLLNSISESLVVVVGAEGFTFYT